MKRALVCGAGGFIGGHPSTTLRTGLVKKLKREGYWVRGVDLEKREHEFSETPALWNTSIDSAGDIRTPYSTGQADEFLLLDLREPHNCWEARTCSKSGCVEM